MMPGVSRGEMNGGYNEFEHGHLRSSSYANGYDPYRKGREEFRDGPRRHNGIDDLDQNSFEMRESRDPTFEVDHLATYTSKSGVTHPEDGLTKLKQMESSTGIWTMRCSLIIERYHIVVIDKGNGDELERFPMANVHEPTAVLKNDRRETYNNLLLFSIIDDPRRKNSPSDMHIFQSINVPAHDLVDEILTAKGETARSRDPPDQRIPPPPRVPAPEPPYYGKSDIHTSLRESQGPGYGAEPPLESRLQETRLDGSRIDSSRRFTDASRWIHSMHSSPVQERTHSPQRQPFRQLAIDYPGGVEVPGPYSGYVETYSTQQRSRKKDGPKGNNYFGTWSGGSYNNGKGTGKGNKKGKKWFQIGFNKTTLKKSKSEKENVKLNAGDGTLAQLSRSRSASAGNLLTSSMRRRTQSETRGADWSTDPSWGLDEVDTGDLDMLSLYQCTITR